MAVWVIGTIVDDDGSYFFRTDRGDLFRINAQVESSYTARAGNPPLADGLKLEADINDRDGKVLGLQILAAPKPQPKKDRFHNPYNFIPAPPFKPDPPEKGSGVPLQANGLEQGPPAGHHRWHEERYSGRIAIEIKSITPLLLPDPDAQGPANGHKVYRTLRDEMGRPVLPVTSLKGALRSAYEAITNSRMGVMDGNDRLAYREPTEAALEKVPCRIEAIHADGSATLGLYHDASGLGRFGMAWFPVSAQRRQKVAHDNHLRKANATIIAVDFDVEDMQKKTKRPNPRIYSVLGFEFIESGDRASAVTFRNSSPKPRNGKRHHYTANGAAFSATGYLLASNVGNFSSHHDERLFFVRDDEASRKAFDDNMLDVSTKEFKRLSGEWSNLIRNARKEHERVLNPSVLGPESKHSRHLYDDPPERDGTKLKAGDMFYVTIDRDPASGERRITAMSPVLISRALYDKSPRSLLHSSLLPATGWNELSPADRVFGWAHESGDGAFRGQLRIAPVRFKSGNGIVRFESPLPLAILGEPKPAQWLFYGAEDETGKCLKQDTQRASKGYVEGKGIRGRKVYPHQKATAAVSNYWDRTAALQDASRPINATVQGDSAPRLEPLPENAGHSDFYREYVRRRGRVTRINKEGKVTEQAEKPNTDGQNRSIEDWVDSGSTFETTIDVQNLSREELGALLWLLDLNAAEAAVSGSRYHLKLGGGKPLGFGSVEIRVLKADIFTGKAKAQALSNFIGKPASLPEAECKALIDDYRSWLTRHYGAGFKDVSFIAAFLRAAMGHEGGLPTHYPRLGAAPDPVGENFRWFMRNSRKNAAKEPLPALVADRGLPLFEE